jgi:hypothetical protein
MTSFSSSSDKAWINLGSCAVATLAAEFITLPICTTKTVFQNGLGRPPVPFAAIFNPLHLADTQTAVGHIWASSTHTSPSSNLFFSLRGFYRASLPALGAQMLSTSGKYTIYQTLQHLLPPSLVALDSTHLLTGPQMFAKMGVGIFSGILMSLVGGTCASRSQALTHFPLSPRKLCYRLLEQP